MYQSAIKNQVRFFNEFLVLDLLINDGQACGVVALEIRTGEIHTFHAKTVLFATGGYGRAWRVTSNAFACMGDGMSIAYRRGIPLQDMEMYQFHPTGIYKVGVLLSEAARGEGGKLLNGKGEYFMERYMPTLKDLAPRDIVSRCIVQEIKDGNGVDGKDYVYLDVRHLGAKMIAEKLPDITDFARNYLGVEPITEPVPIQPTAHYAMGGIPTDIDARVVIDPQWTPLPGFYAAGEVACVSVHGANRLGTNSLVDLIVFGRRAGKHMAQFIKENSHAPLPADPEATSREIVDRFYSSTGGESAARIRSEMQNEMIDNVFVERNDKGLRHALDTHRWLARQLTSVCSCRTRARSSTPNLSRLLSLASCLTAPRPRFTALWPVLRAGARTFASIIRSVMMSTGSNIPWRIKVQKPMTYAWTIKM